MKRRSHDLPSALTPRPHRWIPRPRAAARHLTHALTTGPSRSSRSRQVPRLRRDSHRRNVSDHRRTRERRPETGRGKEPTLQPMSTHTSSVGIVPQVPSASDRADTRLTPTPTVSSLVYHVLSALGSGPASTSGPGAPAQPPTLWAMLGGRAAKSDTLLFVPSPPPHPRPPCRP